MPAFDDMPPLVPELYVRDLNKSLDFYLRILGFEIAYDRPEKRFAMVRRQGSYLMLDEHDLAKEEPNKPEEHGQRSWITAPMAYPFGRGINFEIETTEIKTLIESVQKAKIPFFLPPEEAWYRAGKVDLGAMQFIVLDPDGYALRFSQSLGERPTKNREEK